jgi:hypothetical protein
MVVTPATELLVEDVPLTGLVLLVEPAVEVVPLVVLVVGAVVVVVVVGARVTV